MLVGGYLNHRGKQCVRKALEVLGLTYFDDSLTQVVAKLIAGCLWKKVNYSSNKCAHELTIFFFKIFKSLLDHTAAALVKT
jgi:hypothetical protein